MSSFSHPFRELLAKLITYRHNLAMKVSGIAEKEFKTNFTRQGFRSGSGSVEKWKKRKSPDKREGKAILIKSGRLRRGFKKQPSHDIARVINDVPYASAHNEGDTSTVNVKSFKRKKAKAKGRSRKKVDNRATQNVKAHKRKNNIPARPFMNTTEPLMQDIENTVLTDVTKIFDTLK